jgi:hypothetical protein
MNSEEKRWLALRAACALVWTAELFWIQGLPFPSVPWMRYPLLFQGVRFFLDLLVLMTITVLLKRRYVVPVLIGNALVLTLLGAYATHFYRPLMPANILSQWAEGVSQRAYVAELIPARLIGVIVAAFVVKLYLLVLSGQSRLPSWFRSRTALLALLLYLIPLVGLQFTHCRFTPYGDMGRVVFVYGYTLPWIVDAWGWLDQEAVNESAHEYFMSHQYDRLRPLEKPLSVESHLVVLQLETIGAHVVDAVYKGEPVMPFLRQLRDKSMRFRIQSFHVNGTCDMDFAVTTFLAPFPGMTPYKLTGIRSENSTPAFMKRHGFSTFVYHGNTQLFYHRGEVLDRLGFDHVYFKEQLAQRRLATSIMGVRDVEIFRCVQKTLRTQKRAFVFVITLDTHSPFNMIEESEQTLIPKPFSLVERYLNSARHLDGCLRDFMASIPDGTAVLLYGDHTASIKDELFASDVVDGKEFVPCLIYQKGADLSLLQQTRGQAISTNGTLNIMDILGYIRNSIATNSVAIQ